MSDKDDEQIMLAESYHRGELVAQTVSLSEYVKVQSALEIAQEEVRFYRREWESACERSQYTIEIEAELAGNKKIADAINEQSRRHLDRAEAAEKVLREIKGEIYRGKAINCTACVNGSDMPEENLCRACWRIWVGGKMYLLWDWPTTENRINSISGSK